MHLSLENYFFVYNLLKPACFTKCSYSYKETCRLSLVFCKDVMLQLSTILRHLLVKVPF